MWCCWKLGLHGFRYSYINDELVSCVCEQGASGPDEYLWGRAIIFSENTTGCVNVCCANKVPVLMAQLTRSMIKFEAKGDSVVLLIVLFSRIFFVR